MGKVQALTVLSDGHEHTVEDVAAAMGQRRVSAQRVLKRCHRQGLVYRRGDGVRYWYSLLPRGARRLDYLLARDGADSLDQAEADELELDELEEDDQWLE